MNYSVPFGPALATNRHDTTTSDFQTLTGAERSLLEASERALRHSRNYVALVLHLSRLRPPAPRSYHIRIARVLMQDSAARFDGRVFAMRNRDVVLLCKADTTACHLSSPSSSASVQNQSQHDDVAASPQLLPGLLGKLFSADADPVTMTSLWHLDGEAAHLFSYLAKLADGPAYADAYDDSMDAVLSGSALKSILGKAPLGELICYQMGMSLDPDRSKSLAGRLIPAFYEFELSLAALHLSPLVSRATADPFLFHHLASGFNAQVVELLGEDLATGGRLTRASVQARLPMHVSLGLDTILTPSFARLARQAAAKDVRLGASISLMQASADLDLLEHARRVLTLAGGELILTGVDSVALDMVRPGALRPDVLKVTWSPTLLTVRSSEERTRRLFAGFDPRKIVLHDVDSQQALAWGQSQGILQFQGRFTDQVQAATRMARCGDVSNCTMRQCGARASSAGVGGRAGCTNPTLLEAGFHVREERRVS